MIALNQKVVLDTNILVSAIMSRDNACRKILNMAFDGRIHPVISHALFAEYESVFARDAIFAQGPFDRDKRNHLLDDILSICDIVEVHYLWRPNLKDNADNFVIELAVAAGASMILTQNLKDFGQHDLHFPEIEVIHPFRFLDAMDKKTGGRHGDDYI